MSKMIPFVSKGKKTTKKDDGKILDHGKIGNLDYEIYSRNVIHIFDKKLKFKKTMDSFEEEMNSHDFEKLKEGEQIIMRGSGDNDHLVFERKNGDLEISLKKRTFNTLEKLKDILSKRSN